jgi:predicted DNA-binding protein
MALLEPSVLANTIMSKLYNVLTNGDETVPKSDDNFFSWCTPGIPVEPADLEYLTQGLTGVVKKSAVDAMQPSAAAASGAEVPAPTPLTPEQLNGLMAQDTMRLYMQAENMARLLDFVPDVAVGTNEQFKRMSVQNNDGSLSDIYDYTLRMSQVMKVDLPPETVKQIERLNGLLQKTVKTKDLITEEEIETTVPSDLVNAYFAKMAAYDNAALEYNTRRIDALTATDPRAVHDWAINANIYRNKVRAALADWQTAGHKTDYEKIAAFFEQVGRRDMSLLKQQYIEDLEKARLTSPISGSDFFFTSLVPGNFANSNGWTRFGFSAGDFQSHSNSSYKWSKASGGGGFSFFGIGGGGSHSESSSHSEYHGSFDSSHVDMSFEIAQVPIARPWLRTAFLTSHYWRFDQNNVVVKGDQLSDGAPLPKGKMPAIPTSAIFVRKLSLKFGESHGFSDFVNNARSQSTSAGGCFAFGPFFAGGHGASRSGSGDTARDHGFRFENNTMFVDGMQIIGFKCHLLPKSPDPSPDIPADAWI